MLDLLSSLKEPKTKTLKLRGQSETTDRPGGSRQAAGQKTWGHAPSENCGGNRAPSRTERLPSDPRANMETNPSPSLAVLAAVLVRQPADSMNPT